MRAEFHLLGVWLSGQLITLVRWSDGPSSVEAKLYNSNLFGMFTLVSILVITNWEAESVGGGG